MIGSLASFLVGSALIGAGLMYGAAGLKDGVSHLGEVSQMQAKSLIPAQRRVACPVDFSPRVDLADAYTPTWDDVARHARTRFLCAYAGSQRRALDIAVSDLRAGGVPAWAVAKIASSVEGSVAFGSGGIDAVADALASVLRQMYNSSDGQTRAASIHAAYALTGQFDAAKKARAFAVDELRRLGVSYVGGM